MSNLNVTTKTRELAAVLQDRSSGSSNSHLNEIRSLLQRTDWQVRCTSEPEPLAIQFFRRKENHSLVELSLEPPAAPAPSAYCALVPVLRLSSSFPGGLDQYSGPEKSAIVDLTFLLREFVPTWGPDSASSEGEPAATSPEGARQGSSDSDASEDDPTIASAPPGTAVSDSAALLQEKSALINEIGHFSTALFSLIKGDEESPVSWDDCIKAWTKFREQAEKGLCPKDLGLYMHVPICTHRCSYCQIPVHLMDARSDLDGLVDTMEFELRKYASVMGAYPVRSMSVGGGTPNLLSIEQTRRLLSLVYELFEIHPLFHFTVDMSTQTASLDKLRVWKDFGASNIVFGVQTLTDGVLTEVNRLHQGSGRVRKAIENAKELGIEAVSVDLIAGLPGETVSSFLDTLDKIVALEPDYIQVFRWILEPKTAAFALHGPDTPEKLEQREEIILAAHEYLSGKRFSGLYKGHLANFGLEYISTKVDLFHVMAQYEMHRSSRRSVLAVGHGAISCVQGVMNYAGVGGWEDYLKWPSRDTPFPFAGTKLSREFAMAAYWAGRIDETYVDRDQFVREFGVFPEAVFPTEIAFLLEKGWLRRDGNMYVLKERLEREYSVIAGALVFSLDELRSARVHQGRYRECNREG